jgi:xanthine dehydrogenase accessory factor
MDVLRRAQDLVAARERAALVTVVSTSGSTPRKPGARMLVLADGRTYGTVGGGRVEQAVCAAAARVLASEVPELVHHKLTQELAMCCGGQMTFFVEPLMSAPRLFVFGLGHVGSAIVQAAAAAGFEVTGIDDLPANATTERLPQAHGFVDSYEPEDVRALPFADDCYVVIATREHALDQKLLELCLPQQWRYLGVIGSERKAAMQRERLLAKGFAPELVARVRCPMGLAIGAHTPEEIAVSVCAELVAERRGARA